MKVTCTKTALEGGTAKEVSLSVSFANGCTASDSMEYTLKASPTVTAPADDTKCSAEVGDNIEITGWTVSDGAAFGTVTPSGCSAGQIDLLGWDDRPLS